MTKPTRGASRRRTGCAAERELIGAAGADHGEGAVVDRRRALCPPGPPVSAPQFANLIRRGVVLACMIYGYEMTVALAEQRRRQLLTEADGRRQVRLARRARKGAKRVEPALRPDPPSDIVDLRAIADVAELVDARSVGQGRTAPCR